MKRTLASIGLSVIGAAVAFVAAQPESSPLANSRQPIPVDSTTSTTHQICSTLTPQSPEWRQCLGLP